MKAGVSQKEITPSVGAALSGYIRRFGCSVGVHDPLLANFLWAEDGNHLALLISLDVMNIGEEFAAKARQTISQEMGLDRDSILVAAVHTHSAPGIFPFRDESQRDRDWEGRVLDKLILGAKEARLRSKKALMEIGKDHVSVGYNRRKSGRRVDSTLSLAVFFDETKKPFCVVANYGCHPVVLKENNLLISSDYVGFFRKLLRRNLSANITTLFFTGAAGDVDPIQRGGFPEAERLAGILCGTAFKIIKDKTKKSGGKILAGKIDLKLPYGWTPSKAEAKKNYQDCLSDYNEALRQGDKEASRIREAFLLWAEELRQRASGRTFPDSLECELQCIKIGEAVFFAFPFELFSSLSLELKRKSGLAFLFLVGYANGYFGYLPDEVSISEGGYEAEEAFKYTGLLPYSPGAGRIFLERALSLLERVK